MTPEDIAHWMYDLLCKEECVYQDDVVDHLLRCKADDLLKENTDGNVVLSAKVLTAFRKLDSEGVVWVRPDRYWRFRVPEDEEGRDARG